MKKMILTSVLFLAAVLSLAAQSEYKVMRDGAKLRVELKVDCNSLGLKSNRMVVLTPLVGDTALESTAVFGRRRWYWTQRNLKTVAGELGDRNIGYKDTPDTLIWRETLPYSRAMEGAQVRIIRKFHGCCDLESDSDTLSVGTVPQLSYAASPVFVRPEAEIRKERSVTGRAYVDFPVSRMEIYPDYHDNRHELSKITAAIDSLKADSDLRLTGLSIVGYASPESPWSNNERLSKGRTAELKKYVEKLYSFAPGFIVTDYVPEDWEGLRNWVESSSLENRDEILSLIDSPLRPDAKEQRIRERYPQQYKTMLEECYPYLRHSDFRISYIVRGYSDLSEMERVFRTNPGKLSLEELYMLSGRYEKGSEEFTRVFEVAAALYPDDEAAALNAGAAAICRGEYETAARFLQKAGGSVEAVYDRAVLCCMREDYRAAAELFAEAARMGYAPAENDLKYINNIITNTL